MSVVKKSSSERSSRGAASTLKLRNCPRRAGRASSGHGQGRQIVKGFAVQHSATLGGRAHRALLFSLRNFCCLEGFKSQLSVTIGACAIYRTKRTRATLNALHLSPPPLRSGHPHFYAVFYCPFSQERDVQVRAHPEMNRNEPDL
jgi:hypothetical protein